MLRKYLPASITALGIILALATLLFINPNKSVVYSAASHVVISEIQLSGGTGLSTSEFVELYNPTGSPVDLTNWKVSKKNAANTVEDFLVSNLGGTIPAHGYFLIGSDTYQSSATVSADATYATDSATLTDDNTIVIYDNSDVIVDKVGLGSATDFEVDAEPNPAAGSSRERKAISTSTSADMAVGGTDELLGNGEDTDNNDNDFNLRTIPQPQNTQSDLEPVEATATPSATPTDSATPTATPEETQSPSPTASPTATATPTVTPTPSPTPEETQTPSPTPSATPTVTPTATPEETESPSPTPVETETPEPSETPEPTEEPEPTEKPDYHRYTCEVRYVNLSFGRFSLRMPMLWCGIVEFNNNWWSWNRFDRNDHWDNHFSYRRYR